MLNRVLARLLLVAALCAAPADLRAVTIPLASDTDRGGGGLQIEISLDAVSQRLASARGSGFDGLRSAGPNAGLKAMAALVEAALDKMPWLGSVAQANGLWTWRHNPTMGVAIYGPGAGGYSSFSWSRSLPAAPPAPPQALAQMANYQSFPASPPNAGLRAGSAPPTPVPVPPAAPMLLAGLAAMAFLGRRRR